jgi:hypothetical protein
MKCALAGYRSRQHPPCIAWAARLSVNAPRCPGWVELRRWAISTQSCRLVAQGMGFRWVIEFCSPGFERIITKLLGFKWTGENQILINQVCQMIHWIRDLEFENTASLSRSEPFRAWGSNYVQPPRLLISTMDTAFNLAKELLICPNRFWNLAIWAPNGHADLLPILEIAADSGNRLSSF